LIGTYILKPFSSAKLRIVMVMIIFPIILNGLYFWVCDNLLKLKINQNDKDLKDFYERESNMGNNGNMNVKHPIDLPLDDDKVKKMNENIELKKNKDNNNIIEDNNINNINSNYAEENTNNNENNYHELNDL